MLIPHYSLLWYHACTVFVSFVLHTIYPVSTNIDFHTKYLLCNTGRQIRECRTRLVFDAPLYLRRIFSVFLLWFCTHGLILGSSTFLVQKRKLGHVFNCIHIEWRKGGIKVWYRPKITNPKALKYCSALLLPKKQKNVTCAWWLFEEGASYYCYTYMHI